MVSCHTSEESARCSCRRTISGDRTVAGPVKSAARALDLLDEIAANGPGTQLQLSTRLSIPKSSLHALLRTMIDRGWLQTDPTGSVYQLGIHSLVVSSAYLDGDPVLSRAASVMDEVAAATEETVHLGRLDGADVIYTAKRESMHPLRMHSAVGRRLPAYATSLGRALLAEHARRAARASWCPSTSRRSRPTPPPTRTPCSRSSTRAGLPGLRDGERGVLHGRALLRRRAALRPHAVDALSVAVPISRLDDGREDLIIETLLSVKARLAAVHDNSLVR